MPTSRGPTEKELNGIFRSFFSHCAPSRFSFWCLFLIVLVCFVFLFLFLCLLYLYIFLFSFYPTSPLYTSYGFQLSVCIGFLSVQTRGSLFLVSPLALLSLLVVLVSFVLLYYILLWHLTVIISWLFSNERQKGGRSRWEGRWGELGRVQGVEL